MKEILEKVVNGEIDINEAENVAPGGTIGTGPETDG